HAASMIAHRFSVVTTLSRSIAPIERNLVKYGLAARCARVRAAEVPVLELERPGSRARAAIAAEVALALVEDGSDAVVLGCAGMADLAADIARDVGAPVLDGVACAVAFAEGLARLGLKTSRRGPYAPPLPKVYSGDFARFSPR
ncbi:MAG: aspartate/glutamate racemase family protein, partial [Hyphomicrobiales bacterium]|nr:aspartate/glutamate racemase family protein [Hyphomicrobiales bacterium]